ncbi:MAG: response regulator [Anaerolineales bacterium]|nr:response regulator [Anaerolineales bacterium]
MPKVLLAEDDPMMVSLLETLLAIEGFEVVVLPEKEDLLENARCINPDAILLDVHFGAQNGIELLRLIRQEPDLQAVRVIMASGIDKSEECLAIGADGFLLKPYMPDDLLRKLRP